MDMQEQSQVRVLAHQWNENEILSEKGRGTESVRVSEGEKETRSGKKCGRWNGNVILVPTHTLHMNMREVG